MRHGTDTDTDADTDTGTDADTDTGTDAGAGADTRAEDYGLGWKSDASCDTIHLFSAPPT